MKNKTNRLVRPKTILSYLLLGLVPYSEQNLRLAFHPNTFFNELEKISMYSPSQLRRAYSHALATKLVTIGEDSIILSLNARQSIHPNIAKPLENRQQLLVAFDMPVTHNASRRQFRMLLRHFGFRQVQQSVWSSEYDYLDIIAESVQDAKISQWVSVYLAHEAQL